jgi:hypothetical protein
VPDWKVVALCDPGSTLPCISGFFTSRSFKEKISRIKLSACDLTDTAGEAAEEAEEEQEEVDRELDSLPRKAILRTECEASYPSAPFIELK